MSIAAEFGYDPFGVNPRIPQIGDLLYSTQLPSGAGKVVAISREPDQFGRAVYRLKVLWTNGSVTTPTNLSNSVALIERMIATREKALTRLMSAREKATKL